MEGTEFETLTLKLTLWAPPYFPIWGKVENFELINEMKNWLVQGIEPLSTGWEFRELTTTPQVLKFECEVKMLLQKNR